MRRGIFGALGAADAHGMAVALGVDYLWVGDLERRFYGSTIDRCAARPDPFAHVFESDEVTIFAVRR